MAQHDQAHPRPSFNLPDPPARVRPLTAATVEAIKAFVGGVAYDEAVAISQLGNSGRFDLALSSAEGRAIYAAEEESA